MTYYLVIKFLLFEFQRWLPQSSFHYVSARRKAKSVCIRIELASCDRSLLFCICTRLCFSVMSFPRNKVTLQHVAVTYKICITTKKAWRILRVKEAKKFWNLDLVSSTRNACNDYIHIQIHTPRGFILSDPYEINKILLYYLNESTEIAFISMSSLLEM